MNKLREAVKNNTKTSPEKDTSKLLDAVGGGTCNDGWGRLGWQKRF